MKNIKGNYKPRVWKDTTETSLVALEQRKTRVKRETEYASFLRLFDMKAPDKIYTDNRGVYAEHPVFSQADANVEYVRKDALIEWADNWKKLGQSDDFLYAIDTLVQHLNAM